VLVAVAVVFAGPTPLVAQDRYRVITTENFRREPTGRATRLATVNAGSEVAADSVFGRWVHVTLEGWMWARSLDSTERDGFDLTVAARAGENLRVEPNGRIVAQLASGALLFELDRRPAWVHVQRSGWMFRGSLEPVGASPGTRPGAPSRPPQAEEAPTETGGSYLDRAVTAAAATLYRTPDGDTTGALRAGAAVRVLARSGEWVRVQMEGWVRERDLESGTPEVLVGVSGAEIRARSEEFRNKLVQWVVQYIAIQDADEIRRDIPEGRRYMLARGPLPESGFVYVILNEEQVEQLSRLPALSELVIVGRVRTGRSHYLGNPVLTLVEAAVRQP
jgi:hypothetical protein